MKSPYAFALFWALTFLAGFETPAFAQEGRPTVGIAFGGGSARGLAHVGVVQWFEEHNIPIDRVAGTSMGGLIGGAFASGMDAAELDDMLQNLDWDQLFGASNFAFKNIRRKDDARAFPSRLEFGLKRGIVPPSALNNGAQVDLLLGRIAAAYYDITTFDDLPTPFRAVSVDLLTASQVVLDRGSLASAMRATMSLPLIFPPVELDGKVLVDGGAMNNVPADVARAMGADRVVAINVGDLADQETVSNTLLGLVGATLDAMMRASTRKSISSADVIINVPVEEFGSLAWRRSAELIAAGYQAAETMRDSLLPLAISPVEYASWKAARQGRRRRDLPVPTFVTTAGFSPSDTGRISSLVTRHVNVPLNITALETDLAELSGLDRYDGLSWRFVTNESGARGLLVRATPKSYGPPFMMLGLNLENTTSESFRMTLTARYLAYDVVGPGSELRIDGTLGSDPGIAFELYKPLGSTPLFVAPFAGITMRSLDVVSDESIVASYGQTVSLAGLNLGVNLGRDSDVRVGAYASRLTARVKVGNPGLPEIEGAESVALAQWRYNGQDSPVIPSRGIAAQSILRYVFDSPPVTPPLPTLRTSNDLKQLSGEMNIFRSLGEANRVFVLAGGGTSFRGEGLPTDQFELGLPLHLGAYNVGELRGDHYYIASGGYFRQLGRLPDFMGGPVFAGAWLENGDTFNNGSEATFRTNLSGGLIMDTLIGPVLVAGSAGFDGRWRTYIGVGRIFAGARGRR